jgi:hypothetical protein
MAEAQVLGGSIPITELSKEVTHLSLFLILIVGYFSSSFHLSFLAPASASFSSKSGSNPNVISVHPSSVIPPTSTSSHSTSPLPSAPVQPSPPPPDSNISSPAAPVDPLEALQARLAALNRRSNPNP